MEVGEYERSGRCGIGVNMALRDLWQSRVTRICRDSGVGEGDSDWWVSS